MSGVQNNASQTQVFCVCAQNKLETSITPSILKRTQSQRCQCRFTDAIRKKQMRQPAEVYAKNTDARRTAVKKYNENNPFQ